MLDPKLTDEEIMEAWGNAPGYSSVLDTDRASADAATHKALRWATEFVKGYEEAGGPISKLVEGMTRFMNPGNTPDARECSDEV